MIQTLEGNSGVPSTNSGFKLPKFNIAELDYFELEF